MVTGHVVKDGKRDAGVEAQLAERTADLQRLQAEYANYRKRVDRDRAAVREQAVVGTLTGLIPVLDAIDKAREHGELSGGFEKVADSLQAALGRLGLVTYGEKGDPFDPKIHEALTYPIHQTSPRTLALRSCFPDTRSGTGSCGPPRSPSRHPRQVPTAPATKSSGRTPRKETRQPRQAG